MIWLCNKESELEDAFVMMWASLLSIVRYDFTNIKLQRRDVEKHQQNDEQLVRCN